MICPNASHQTDDGALSGGIHTGSMLTGNVSKVHTTPHDLSALVDGFAALLECTAPALVSKALSVGALRRARLDPRFGRLERILDQRAQPAQGIATVLSLGTVILRLDRDNAVGADALVVARQQSSAHRGRQCRGARDIELELDRGPKLVDVLAAGALRAHRSQRDVRQRNLDRPRRLMR